MGRHACCATVMLEGWALQRRSPAALQELDRRELLEHIEVRMRSPRHSCRQTERPG